MKKLTIALTLIAAAVSMTGCQATQSVPTVNLDIVQLDTNGNPDDLYEAMTQCVLDNVNPPASGQLFTYQSEKHHQLAFTYGFDTDFPIMGMHHVYESRATVRFDGKRKEIKAQGLKFYMEPSDYSAGGWTAGASATLIDNGRTQVNGMMQALNECIPTYL